VNERVVHDPELVASNGHEAPLVLGQLPMLANDRVREIGPPEWLLRGE